MNLPIEDPTSQDYCFKNSTIGNSTSPGESIYHQVFYDEFDHEHIMIKIVDMLDDVLVIFSLMKWLMLRSISHVCFLKCR